MPATGSEKTTGRPRMDGDASQVMTAQEYVALPDRQNGCAYELVRGALVVRDPGVSWTHSCVQGKLHRYLDEWMEKFGHGEVGVEVDCLLGEDPDTVRVPDVAALLQLFKELLDETVCECKKRPAEALSYNSLVQSWPEIVRLAKATPSATAPQKKIF